jgi:hypothetical protein
MSRLVAPLLGCLAALALSGCERSQADDARLKKSDAKASQGAAPAYTASGWTPGDEASWQNQIRARTEGQNEYVRVPASHLGGGPAPASLAVPGMPPAPASAAPAAPGT